MKPYIFTGTPHETASVLVAADTQEAAANFLLTNYPSPDGWKWQFDGKDANYWSMWWFVEVNI